MNDMNPQAMPFQPSGGGNDPRAWNGSRDGLHPQPMPPAPPFEFAGAPWNSNYHPPPPPPPPPQYYPGNQYGYGSYEAQQQAHAYEQARSFYGQWAPSHGSPGPQLPFHSPYGPPPRFSQPPYSPHFHQQHRPQPRQSGYPHPHPAHYSTVQQANWPKGATNEELQAPTQPSKKSKKAKAKAKAAANGVDTQQDTPTPGNTSNRGRYGEPKIMLPAPQPTDLYLDAASQEPSLSDHAGHVLVILDLNGTVLYRPNRNAKTMIARPYLKPFLQYLFQNFKVMVWSSARPENVKSLVDQVLDKDLRSMLTATWARDTFGLSAKNYGQNVQVYKNLRLVWSRDQIQQHHPKYAAGERFGQHNTVLIDDSALKASAQPHNLLEIPEFEATPEQMEGDVLREVAGYLEGLRFQSDVSKYIRKEPFKADGRWGYDWPAESAGGGNMTAKVSLKGKQSLPSTAAPVSKLTEDNLTPARDTTVSDVSTSLSSVKLDSAQEKHE